MRNQLPLRFNTKYSLLWIYIANIWQCNSLWASSTHLGPVRHVPNTPRTLCAEHAPYHIDFHYRTPFIVVHEQEQIFSDYSKANKQWLFYPWVLLQILIIFTRDSLACKLMSPGTHNNFYNTYVMSWWDSLKLVETPYSLIQRVRRLILVNL